uniref:RNA-directed DNA polymerase n=1 Tax=Caenorhabditis tropicalis TaxID=1561998 RepID=A0A1I7U677_9PELO
MPTNPLARHGDLGDPNRGPPVSPGIPDNVPLRVAECLEHPRHTRNTIECLYAVKDAVTEDLATVHTKLHEIATLTADRLETFEVRLKALEHVPANGGARATHSPSNSGNSQGNTPAEEVAAIPLAPPPTPAVAQLMRGAAFSSPRVPPANNTPPHDSSPEQHGSSDDEGDEEDRTPRAPRPTHTRGDRPIFNVLEHKVRANIPIFSGAPNENFATFLRSFNDHANAAKVKLAPDEKRNVFLTYLSDFARDKAEELFEDGNTADFDQVVTHLRKTFQDPTRAEMERQQLRQCTQKANESVDEFSTRVRRLAQTAYLDKSREYVQDKAREAFTDGLTGDIKFHVKSQSPKTFQDAHNAAIKYELLLAEAAKTKTVSPQGLMVTPAPQQTVDQSRPPQYSRPPPQRNNNMEQRRRGACHYCGIEGHFASECRRRLREQSNGRWSNGPSNQRFGRGQRQFPANNPVLRHQIGNQNQRRNGYVNSFEPQDPAMDQLRADLQASRSQVEALVKRNAELAAATLPIPRRGINVISSLPSLGTLLTLFTLTSLFCAVAPMTPLMCMPHTPETFIRLPAPLDCKVSEHISASTNVQPMELAVFRDNTVSYETNGTLCKIVERTTSFSVNLFGARWQETSSKQITVSSEECHFMKKFGKCAHGDSHNIDGIFKTNNAHSIDWPTAPFSVFQGVQKVVTYNCFMLHTTVGSRYGSDHPISAAGSMTGCRFATGACNTREGTAFIWKPVKAQTCRYIHYQTMKGHKSGRIWLSADKEFSLSFNGSSERFVDCGIKLLLTDQGYAVMLPSRTKRQSSDLPNSTSNMTNFVTSNQLPAQLMASELATLDRSATWFRHNFMSFCNSANAHTAATLAAVASSPTMAARRLTGRNGIQAKYIGDETLAIKSCSPLAKDAFEFVPFTDTCYSKPSVRVRLPNNASIVTFVDLTTSILTNRAYPIDCSLATNFEFVKNGTLVSLNPFTLETKTSVNFHPQPVSGTAEFTMTPLVEEPLIFHNLVIGSLSENIPDAHYDEIWEAMQGSPEALTRIINSHSDPSSGTLPMSDVKETVNWWLRAKYIAEIAFFIWTLLCNLTITILVTVAVAYGVAKFYVGPWLLSIHASKVAENNSGRSVTPLPTPVASPTQAPWTPRTRDNEVSSPADTPSSLNWREVERLKPLRVPDCSKAMQRLRPPAYTCSLSDRGYFTAQIPITANGISFWALVDTGAGFTVASQAICPLIGVSRLNPPTVDHAVGLGGNEVGIAGSTPVTFVIGSIALMQNTNFTVGKCCPEGINNYDFILGNDILSRLPKFHLDYTNGFFEMGDDKLPLGTLRDRTVFPSKYEVHMYKDTIIPPMTEAFVQCVVPLCSEDQDLVLISQANTISHMDLMVAPAIFANATPKLLFTNPTNEPKLIYANTTVATATDLNAEDETPSATEEVEVDPEFKVDLSHAKVSEEERAQLAKLIDEFHDVFSKNSYDLGSSETEPVHIYTNTEVPVKGRPYRVPVKYQAELEKHINSLLRSSRITESNTPWTSPIVLVKKKNGSLRVCLDFRKLNEVTIPDNFPLPRIDGILEKVGGSKFFSSLDMANGYLQLRLDPASSYKCGFITESKVYAYTHMPFGLKSAASYFQRALRTVLGGLEEEVLVYIDDILIFSKTFSDHLRSLRKVLMRFRDFNLKASPKKCEFAKTAITFLGHEISRNTYSPDKANVAKIMDFPTPANINEIRRFVGMAGFFRKFIPGFSDIAEPLTRLTRKDLKFVWDQDQQAAFEKLRGCLSSEPVLGYPDYDKPFHIFCDASAVAQGAALMQSRPENGKDFYAIAYASRTLSDPETRWPAIQVEMGAIIFALRQFRPYVCMSKIILHSDHKPLTFLLQKSKTHDNLARWLIELQCYDITIVHIDGKKNTVADCLSRALENEDPANHKELKDIVEFPVCMKIHAAKTAIARRKQPTVSLDFAAEQEKDPDILAIKRVLQDREQAESLPASLTDRMTLSTLAANGTVLTKPSLHSKRDVLFVPKHLTDLIFDAFHESFLSGGHFSWKKTLAKISRRYFWRSMAKDVSERCLACEKCQLKNSPVPAYRERMLTVETNRVFQKVGLDLTGPFRTTDNGNKYVLNIVCWFSKFVIAVPIKDARSETSARALLNEAVLKYGAMTEIVTDNATTFTSQAFADFVALLAIKHHRSIPYWSKGNGATERSFRTFHQLTSKYVNRSHTDWDLILPALAFCYNTTVHATTEETPFFLMHGRDPIFSIDRIIDPSPVTQLADDPSSIDDFRQEMATKIREAWKHAKQQADKARETFVHTSKPTERPSDIKVGDRVLFKNYLSKKDLSKKLVLPWVGQFRVIEVNRPEAVIQDINRPTKTKRVHLDQIKKFHEITGPAATTNDTESDDATEATAPMDEVPPNPEVVTEKPVEPDEVTSTEQVPESATDQPVSADAITEQEQPTEQRYNLRRKRTQPDRLAY